MAYFHKNLTSEKWNNLTKDKQILNIGSELMRVRNWLINNNEDYKIDCLNRVYELIDLTIDDKKWHRAGLKELIRFREIMGDYYLAKEKDIMEFNKLLKVLFSFTPESAMVKI